MVIKKKGKGKSKKVTLEMARKSQKRVNDKWCMDLSFKGITTVPKEVLALYGKDEVNLSRNLIEKLPHFSDTMENITTLDLHSNKLQKLPGTIYYLKNLQVLNLCHNHLRELPRELGLLKKLHTLLLGMNQLKALPAAIGELTGLQHIGLSDNQFTRRPRCLAKMVNLVTINMDRNPIPIEQLSTESYRKGRLCLVRKSFLCEVCLNNCRTERRKIDEALMPPEPESSHSDSEGN